MTVLASLAGAALILVGLHEIFHTLFHPRGRGSLSPVLMHLVWRAFRLVAQSRPTALSLAGPFAMLTAFASWAALLIVGWALLYWQHLPAQFQLGQGLSPEANDGFLSALYLSLVTFATLGYGDIVPTAGLLRMLAPLEALVGFGFFTASITWVLSVDPVLARKRNLAHEVDLLRAAAGQTGLRVLEMEAASIERLLARFTTQVVAVRGDLLQWPVSFYFHVDDERSSLPVALPYLLRLAEEGRRPGCRAETRLHAEMLHQAVQDLSEALDEQPAVRKTRDTTGGVLEAYRVEHLRRIDED